MNCIIPADSKCTYRRRGETTSGTRVKRDGGDGWDEDDVVPPEAKGETANSGDEVRGKGVKFDLHWEQIAELWEPCQKLSYLDGCHPRIPGGQVSGMCQTAKEMSHRVVDGVAVIAGRVIGPAYGVAVGLEHRAGRGRFGNNEAEVVRLDQLEREWSWTLCWVAETGRSPRSSGIVGGVWQRGKHPRPARHQRWEEGLWVVTSYSQAF